VTVQTRNESEKVDPARFFAMMESIWADQKARGHVPRSREEIDAEINQMRDDAEDEMQAVERLREECQRARQQAPEH
jgi:hypothetical protein